MSDMTEISPTEQALVSAGVPTEDPVEQEYWGTDERFQWYLPGSKVQYIEHKKLNEGDRRQYQNAQSKDVRLKRDTGDALIKMDAGEERHALIVAAVTNWHLLRNGQPVPFSKGSKGANLEQWLNAADPSIVDKLEKDIRDHNPWLLNEMTVEAIDQQIDELKQMRQKIVDREEGKESSSQP